MTTVTIKEIERTGRDVQFKRYEKQIFFDGIEVAHLILYPDFYASSWDTSIVEEDGINEMRDFIRLVEADPYDPVVKDIGVYADCVDRENRRKFQYQTFKHNSSYFRRNVKQVQKIGMTGIRVNAPSMDIWFSGIAYDKQRKFGVITNLDFSDKLPYLMQRTHAMPMSDTALPELSSALRQHIGKYGGRKLREAV